MVCAHGMLRRGPTRTCMQVWEDDAVLETLRKTFRELRKLPLLDLSVPLVVLVGMPNVGKSSIVSRISTGNPQVRHYPFTTRIAKVTSVASGQQFLHAHSPTHSLMQPLANSLAHSRSPTHSPLTHLCPSRLVTCTWGTTKDASWHVSSNPGRMAMCVGVHICRHVSVPK